MRKRAKNYQNSLDYDDKNDSALFHDKNKPMPSNAEALYKEMDRLKESEKEAREEIIKLHETIRK